MKVIGILRNGSDDSLWDPTQTNDSFTNRTSPRERERERARGGGGERERERGWGRAEKREREMWGGRREEERRERERERGGGRWEREIETTGGGGGGEGGGEREREREREEEEGWKHHEKLRNPLLVEIDRAERLPFWVVGAIWSFAALLCETTADWEDLPRYVSCVCAFSVS